MKMRTITQFWRELREADPHNAVGLGCLRAAVADGTIPTFKVGRRYLLDADTALGFLFASAGHQSGGCARLIKVEKARPGAATPGRAWDNAGSKIYYTTPTKRAQVSVFDRLPQGEENAIRSVDLARLCGCKSVRELQSVIAMEREHGKIILSTCRGGGGYYRPSDGEAGKREINAFVATLASRALNTLKALKAARRELKTIDGQINLDELEEALRAVVAMEGADEQQTKAALPEKTV